MAEDASPPSIDGLAGASADAIAIADLGDARLILFNRPDARNALTRDMRRRFAALLAQADADPAIGCVIVAGAGGCFSAGVDLRESRAEPGPIVRPHPGEALRAMTKPVIAAVDGPCVTGGLEIALSCSFIIATDRARFADTHAKVGLFPAWGQSALLPRAIGLRRARQMSLSGLFVDAPTALAWGLVNEVVPAGALLPRCLELAVGIAAADPRSVAWQQAIWAEQDGAPMAQALAAEDAAVPRWRAGETSYR